MNGGTSLSSAYLPFHLGDEPPVQTKAGSVSTHTVSVGWQAWNPLNSSFRRVVDFHAAHLPGRHK